MKGNRNIYLDYSATTPVKEDVLNEMVPYFTEYFGNPSSLYSIGEHSRNAIDKARNQVASLVGADPSEIYFTAGGSESDNWAIRGVADKYKDRGRHIITSCIEHPAILRTCEFLERHGFEVTYLDIDSEGFVSTEALEDAIREDTILVSVMMINNEIGTIEPIKELAEVSHRHGVLFHTDAVQAVGNIPIDVKEMGIDLMSMSAHKIYGPKGQGGMYIRKGLRLDKLIYGGAQEKGMRAGTENLAGIVGFGKAAELAEKNLEEHRRHCSSLRNYLVERVLDEVPDTVLNGPKDMTMRHPGNANISFDKIEGESILILLNNVGIAISTGSACSSKSLKPSHVLVATGLPIEKVHGTVRFTVGDFTTKEDIDYTVENLKDIIERLREISPF